jgi:peptidoglycan glycosyltransferase
MLGQDLLEYAGRFGFNRDINLIPRIKDYSYNAETSLAFTWNDNKKDNGEIKSFSPIDFKRNPKLIAQGAIGQNLVTATPLQMAVVASAIANSGVVLNPYIVKEIRTGDGQKILFSARPVQIGRAVKESTASEIKRLMEEVMQTGTGKDVKKIYFENGRYTTHPSISPLTKGESKGGNPIDLFTFNNPSNIPPLIKGGEGGFFKIAIVKVAGKTGTAEVGDKNGNGEIDPSEKPHSWFIGFAPAGDPKVAIAVIAENQGVGRLTAAPIAMDVLAEALNAR